MIRYIILLLSLLLWGCSGKTKDDKTIHVSVLRGPSAIAFSEWLKNPPVIDGHRIKVKIIDSPDLMQATLVKKEADIAVLPMINAANLYNKKIRYILTGCPIWGTLYMVEKTSIETDNHTLHLFGTGTTPEILTRYYLDKHDMSYQLNYSFATAREITQGLYMDKIGRAVLSEPFLSIALRRDSTLRIIADLNNLEDKKPGYAQTAILLSPDLKIYQNTLDSLLLQSCKFAVENPEETIRILEEHNVFPNGILTKESIERCEIRYASAIESRESIYRFLQLIYEYEPKAIGGKLPDDNFITKPEL